MHLILQLVLFAASQKMALFGFNQGEGVNDTSFRAVIDTLAGEVRSSTTAQVITPDEIKTLLSAEEHKQMLGCSSESCFAEIGGALGADRILTGSIGKVGNSMLLVVKIVHTKRVGEVRQVSRRLKGGGIDEVLDAIPGAVKELFGPAPTTAKIDATPAPAPVPAPAPAPAVVVPVPTPVPAAGPAFEREGSLKPRPFANADAVKQRVKVYADSAGRVLIAEPKSGLDTLIFHGTSAGLYQQRLQGGGRNGDRIDHTFLDGRFRDGWQRGVTFVGDVATVQCGDQKTDYKLLAAKEANAALKAPLFMPLLTYTDAAIATDATGVYYYVDREAAKPRDQALHRLFIGRKGKLTMIPVEDVIPSEGATSFITAQGRLVVGEKHAEWTQGDKTTKLDPGNLFMKAPMVFAELGAYPTTLQTPCDPL